MEGTTGEAPGNIVLVQTREDVDALEVDDPDKVAYITQTTLAVDETLSIIARLRERSPSIAGPKPTTSATRRPNRQDAVKQLAPRLRPGARDRLQELVELEPAGRGRQGARRQSHLIDNEGEVREEWLEGVDTVGITSGASAPEELVQRLVDFFRKRGAEEVSELEVEQGGRALHDAARDPAAPQAAVRR